MNDGVTAAPQDGGQAAPAPAPTPAEGAASFLDSFTDPDTRGFVENKGWKGPQDVVESYRNYEKLRGVPADQIMQLPADMSDREAMMPVYAKLGMPETADQYTNVLGDGFDSNVFKSVAAQAHALGLGDGQFQGLQQIMAEQSQAVMEAQETAAIEAFDQWKSGNADGFNNAAKLMADVGMNEEGLDQLLSGDKAAMYDFLAKVASRTQEAPVVQGDPSAARGFQMTPAQAQAKIDEKLADKSFTDRYYSDNKKIRAGAVNEMEALMKIKNGEK